MMKRRVHLEVKQVQESISNTNLRAENKEGEGGEEKKEEETDKLGRINFKLDYNFEKNTLAVTVIQVRIEN